MISWQLALGDALTADLAQLASTQPATAARWTVLLRSLAEDPEAIREMLDPDTTNYEINVSYTPVLHLSTAASANIWRLKPERDEPLNRVVAAWRLLYAPDYRPAVNAEGGDARTVWALGLMPREEDYHVGQPHVRRAIDEYNRRGLQPLFRP